MLLLNNDFIGYEPLEHNVLFSGSDTEELYNQNLKSKSIELVGAENVIDLPIRLTSEDFSFYSEKIPVCFFRLGVANIEKGITYGVHHPKFDIDNDSIAYGMKLILLAVC